jgi:acetyl-CoA carboxylase carboxyl transferase subunit alpha
MAIYLDFESSIQKIEDELIEAKIKNDKYAVEILETKLNKELKSTYKNLKDFQKLQLARHPERPYALDYVRLMMRDAYEIHGDRHFSDDSAIICYMGYIGDQKAIVIGEQKGRGTKNKLKRNFGMPNPEGYRKALRAVKLAEKFDIPVLMLIDTPGAYPGIGAEERSQSEAIARNLYELSDSKAITISIVIGEGGSGGALAIGVADKLAMMRYSVFSVISPEGCAAILWSDPAKADTAANALKITAEDLEEFGIIDDVLDEPLIGAHKTKEESAEVIKNYFLNSVKELSALSQEERLQKRYDKLMALGKFSEE